MKDQNLIIRKTITVFLIIALVFTGLFSFPMGVYAEKRMLSEETYYHLDMGVQIAYAGDEWEDRGFKYGLPYDNLSTTIEFPEDIKLIDAYPLNSSVGTAFDFNGATSSTNIPDDLKKECVTASLAYNKYYRDRTSTDMTKAAAPSGSGNKVTFSYNALFNTTDPLEVVLYGRNKWDNQVWKLFGGKDQVSDPVVKAAIEIALTQGASNTAGNNKLYLVFCPTVIEYKKYVTVGDLGADLNLPASVKQEEYFEVSDASIVDASLTVKDAEISYRVDGGAWQPLAIWQGKGTAGVNTGGKISQSFDKVCTVDYRIIENCENGQSSTKIKTVNVTDNRIVEVDAILQLPLFSHEGHPVIADDLSEFKIAGVYYSARRAYEEGAAKNSFVPVSVGGGATVDQYSKTSAKIVFPKRGNYNVRLNVNTVDGKYDFDTKPIEIKKTPCIYDNLGGFQKQNRKQILNIAVATYPGKPIVDYYVELRDLKTGQYITLTQAKPQVNNATIKTRTIKTTCDQYYTNYELEFLTKTPAFSSSGGNLGQDFRYTIYMKDSKGDTDTVQKIFTVKPDLPPVASISAPESFIRNKGANIAEIKLEDASTTDGDQLNRKWTIGTKAIETLPAFKDTSFGSKQNVQYNKIGVGKENISLHVKDVWNEPTLEEYVTEADYLSSTTSGATEVINIAPVVRLEAKRYTSVNISIIADREFKIGIENQLNDIRVQLLEKGIDGIFNIIPVDKPYKDLTQKTSYHSSKCGNCIICQRDPIIADSEYAFIVKPLAVQQIGDGVGTMCIGKHYIWAMKESADANNASCVWQYVVNESSDFDISEDINEKYILIHCYDTQKTIILNRNNGAYLTTINKTIPKSPFISEDSQRFYFADTNGLYKYDISTGTNSTLFKDQAFIPRLQEGKLMYVAKEGAGLGKFYIGKFDLTDETIERVSLPNLDPIDTCSPVEMDTSGKVVFKQEYYRENRYKMGYRIWYTDSKTNTMVSASASDWQMWGNNPGLVTDETGKAVAYYRYAIFTGQSKGAKNMLHIYITKINSDGTLQPEVLVRNVSTYINTNNIIYAKYHTNENAIYMVQGANVDPYGGTSGLGYKIDFDTLTTAQAYPNGLGSFCEYISENGNLVFSRYTGMSNADVISSSFSTMRYNNTKEQSELKSTYKFSKFRNDMRNYIVEIKDIGDDISENIKDLSERFALTGLTAKLSNISKDISEKISLELEKEIPMLHLKGDKDNIASVENTITLPTNDTFEYEYDLVSTSGAAVDLVSFQPIATSLAAGEKEYFKEVLDVCDFNVISNAGADYGYRSYQLSPYIRGTSTGLGYFKGCRRSEYTGLAAGLFEGSDEGWYQVDVSFYLAKPGYVDFYYYMTAGPSYCIGSLDGIRFGTPSLNGQYSNGSKSSPVRRFAKLPAGSHTISLRANRMNVVAINKVEIGYLYDSDSELSKTSNIVANKVKGTFNGPKGSGYVSKRITEKEFETDIWKYCTVYGGPTLSKGVNSCSSSGKYNGSGPSLSFNVVAPSDKMLFLMCYDYVSNGQYPYYQVTRTCSNAIELGSNCYLIKPGGTYQFYAGGRGMQWYGNIGVNTIKIAEIPISGSPITSNMNFISGNSYSVSNMSLNTGTADFIEVKSEGNKIVFDKITKVGRQSFTKKMKLIFSTASLPSEKDQYISNFKLYRKTGNKKLALSENFFSEWFSKSQGWIYNSLAKIEIPPEIEKEERDTLVYKKGELVAYDIFYEDYENDPSKKQYWLYTHTPMNDGEHKDAAIVCDEDGAVKKILGEAVTNQAIISATNPAITIEEAFQLAKSKGSKTLASSIPRFYVDGKYTVYHWQEDNTNRNGDPNVDYTKYDKLSNVEQITFYIEGGSIAPWVTSIKTIPGVVKEGDLYKLQIGVDDVEKDVLRLTTEVYKDKKLIFTHKQANITADVAGNYPYVTTGDLPVAASGKYEVVCTVRDQKGAGLGQYKYYVLSDGKITGEVNHTEKWNDNRKKYNLKRFDDEINSQMQLNDYVAMLAPRKRGINVFWSGEKFELKAKTLGEAEKVNVQIFEINSKGLPVETQYKSELQKTNEKTKDGEEIWKNTLWHKSMINKWGRKAPEELIFVFKATYKDKREKTWEARIIVDSKKDYWQLHRLW